MDVLLISTEYIKSRSSIFENVSDKTLREAVADSQEIYIEPLLGTELYDSILAEVDGDTLTQDNKLLLDDYVVNTLKFYSLLEATSFVKTAYTPTGIKTLTQDSSQEIFQNEFKAYQAKWESRAEFYAQKTINFLKEENLQGKYPLYSAVSDRLDSVNPAHTQFTSKLYLGPGKGRGCSSEFYEYEGN